MGKILLPVGRFVGGSLSKLFQATDNKGVGKLIKGTNDPLMRCNFGVAIPKQGEQHWNQTAWGAQIYAVGVAGWPAGEYQSPMFAWKIVDGDSQIPNKKGNKPCDQVGYPGHWVMWFSQSWLPKKVNANGTQELADPEAIQPGYYIQVLCDCKDNAPSESPGVYLNPDAVALAGYGERIATASDVDTTNVGFGTGPLPAGATAVPVGMNTAPANMGGGVQVPPPALGVPTPGAVVAPHPAFLNGPPTPAPVAPPAPPVHTPLGFTLTAAAGNTPVEAYFKAGWTKETLIANGLAIEDVSM